MRRASTPAGAAPFPTIPSTPHHQISPPPTHTHAHHHPSYILAVNSAILADTGGPCRDSDCSKPSPGCRFGNDPGYLKCVADVSPPGAFPPPPTYLPPTPHPPPQPPPLTAAAAARALPSPAHTPGPNATP